MPYTAARRRDEPSQNEIMAEIHNQLIQQQIAQGIDPHAPDERELERLAFVQEAQQRAQALADAGYNPDDDRGGVPAEVRQLFKPNLQSKDVLAIDDATWNQYFPNQRKVDMYRQLEQIKASGTPTEQQPMPQEYQDLIGPDQSVENVFQIPEGVWNQYYPNQTRQEYYDSHQNLINSGTPHTQPAPSPAPGQGQLTVGTGNLYEGIGEPPRWQDFWQQPEPVPIWQQMPAPAGMETPRLPPSENEPWFDPRREQLNQQYVDYLRGGPAQQTPGTLTYRGMNKSSWDQSQRYMQQAFKQWQLSNQGKYDTPEAWQEFWRIYTIGSMGLEPGVEATDPLKRMEQQLMSAYDPNKMFGNIQFDFNRALSARDQGLGTQLNQRAAGMGIQGAFDPLGAAQMRSRQAVTQQAQAAYQPMMYGQQQQYQKQAEELFGVINKADMDARLAITGAGV